MAKKSKKKAKHEGKKLVVFELDMVTLKRLHKIKDFNDRNLSSQVRIFVREGIRRWCDEYDQGVASGVIKRRDF